MNGQKYDTGQVLRKEMVSIGEGQIGSADWVSVHMKLVLELFRKLDTQFEKIEESDKKERKDLWGRLNGSKLSEADVAAALRHNLNLLLMNVR